MKQVKVLLMFTAAIRNAERKLHLSTTEHLLPYFHAHAQYNYGRWDGPTVCRRYVGNANRRSRHVDLPR